MNDQNRLRLTRIAAQYASRATPKPTAPQEEDEHAATFLAAFARVRDEVLRPAMAEVGLQLKRAGYAFRISAGGDESSPSIDFHVMLADRGDSKDTVRFFARKDAVQGWLVIGELELTGSPVELTRFETTKEITHDVAEQLVVDGVEQMLAPTEAPRRRTPSHLPPAATPAPAPGSPSKPASAETKSDSMGLGGVNLSRANLSKAVLAGARFDDAVMVDTLGGPTPEAPGEAPAPTPEPIAGKTTAEGEAPPPVVQPPPPPPPFDVPGRHSAEALPGTKPTEPVVAMERPAPLAAPRSPLAVTSLSIDVPRGPALPFTKSASVQPGGLESPPAAQPVPVPRLASPAGLPDVAGTLSLPEAAGSGATPPAQVLPFRTAGGDDEERASAEQLVARLMARLGHGTASGGADQRPDPSGTVDLAHAPPAPVLPFDAAKADLPAPPPSLPGVQRAPAELSGTMGVIDPPVGPALPFVTPTGERFPLLTLEQYVAFRASLTVKGEEDAETWKAFGLKTLAAKEALQAWFAGVFRDKPDVRDRFVEMVRNAVDELRRKAPGE